MAVPSAAHSAAQPVRGPVGAGRDPGAGLLHLYGKKKTVLLFCPLYALLESWSFCQDRLGANIGKELS